MAIMASSVSSERAFSAAGITISKRRNRLRHDIVEALQFLKCAICKDLIHREPSPSLALELDLDDVEEEDGSPDWEDVLGREAWDSLWLDNDDEDKEEDN
jgi:hypothetical protein